MSKSAEENSYRQCRACRRTLAASETIICSLVARRFEAVTGIEMYNVEREVATSWLTLCGIVNVR